MEVNSNYNDSKHISFYKDSLNYVAETYSPCLPQARAEAYFAYLISWDGTKDHLLAAALMRNPERLVDYSTYNKWSLEHFKATLLLRDLWKYTHDTGENWYRVLFSVSSLGEMKLFFSEDPFENQWRLENLSADDWTRIIRKTKASLPVLRP